MLCVRPVRSGPVRSGPVRHALTCYHRFSGNPGSTIADSLFFCRASEASEGGVTNFGFGVSF